MGLAAEHGKEKTVMIDATSLKAHRTATGIWASKRGARPSDRAHQERDEFQTTCRLR